MAASLEAVEIDTLRARFDPNAMAAAEIYPNVWEHADDEEFESYLAPNFAELRSFYSTAAADGQGVLLVLA